MTVVVGVNHSSASVFVCLHDRMKWKPQKLWSPNLPLQQGQSIMSSGYRTHLILPRSKSQRSQGHKVQKCISDLKTIECPLWVCTLSSDQRQHLVIQSDRSKNKRFICVCGTRPPTLSGRGNECRRSRDLLRWYVYMLHRGSSCPLAHPVPLVHANQLPVLR